MFRLLLIHHQRAVYKIMYIYRYTLAFRVISKFLLVWEDLCSYAPTIKIHTTKQMQKKNVQIEKELKITPILDKLLE